MKTSSKLDIYFIIDKILCSFLVLGIQLQDTFIFQDSLNTLLPRQQMNVDVRACYLKM